MIRVSCRFNFHNAFHMSGKSASFAGKVLQRERTTRRIKAATRLAQPAAGTMKDELQPSLQREFTLSALRAGIRVDGRPLDASRIARIELGPAHGQAYISLGRTVAVASASAEAVSPYQDRPAEGSININVELSAASSEAAALEFAVHGAQPASDRASMMLRGIVERVIRDSRALDTEALCILVGKKVWAVTIDVAVVDAAGNAVDAAHLAAMAALLHARRNDVSISGTDVHVHPYSEREPLPLPIHHVPLTVSYALFAATTQFPDDIAVLDPLAAEELASDGALTVAMNSNGEVCGLHKAGGLPLDPSLVVRCAQVASERVVQLTELLNKALKDSTAKHHPLSVARPVLVAPEPTAIAPASSMKKGREHSMQEPDTGAETTTQDEAKQSSSDPKSGSYSNVSGLSSWNAVRVNDAPPPVHPVKTSAPTKSVTQTDTVVGNNRLSDLNSSAGLSSASLHTLIQNPQMKAIESPRFRRDLSNKPIAQVEAKNNDSNVSDESSSDDSDEDLMAAVISKPRGGYSRKKASINTSR